jgi:hypothetical protein
MFRQVHVLFRKSKGSSRGYEVLVPVCNAQVVFRIEDIDLHVDCQINEGYKEL